MKLNIENLKQAIGDFNILMVQETGSVLFSQNPRDEDYVVVIENWDKDYKLLYIDGCDCFCHSLDLFEKKCKIQANSVLDIYAIGYEVGTVVYGEKPIQNYSWYDYRFPAIQAILSYGATSFFSPYAVVRGANGLRVCGKSMCWALLAYFAIVNGSFDFTPAQKEVLQLCHDKQLPYDYVEGFKKQLKTILSSQEIMPLNTI